VEPAPRPDLDPPADASPGGTSEHLLAYADAIMLWSDPPHLDEAIDVYERAIERAPGDGPAHFHLGVAYRARAESAAARDGDFARAIEQWRRALEIDPNQYIWRRRIQQYGPRLDKPYPFYDWMSTARAEIEARGETPVALRVEPLGAEIAEPGPGRTVDEPPARAADPDPEGRIGRDERGFIRCESVVVLDTGEGVAARVHLLFRPDTSLDAHWSNEGGGLGVWIDPPAGWTITRRWHEVPRAAADLSEEVRRVEFEVVRDAGAPSRGEISAYALYYACEGADGACLFLRQDIRVPLGD